MRMRYLGRATYLKCFVRFFTMGIETAMGELEEKRG